MTERTERINIRHPQAVIMIYSTLSKVFMSTAPHETGDQLITHSHLLHGLGLMGSNIGHGYHILRLPISTLLSPCVLFSVSVHSYVTEQEDAQSAFPSLNARL